MISSRGDFRRAGVRDDHANCGDDHPAASPVAKRKPVPLRRKVHDGGDDSFLVIVGQVAQHLDGVFEPVSHVLSIPLKYSRRSLLRGGDAVTNEKREAVQFACEVLGRAVHQDDETFRFTLYWVALELISHSKGDGVAVKLGNAYGTNKTFASRSLEFDSIYKLRHAVVHKGKRAVLDARMERVMQCCFVDLLRARLDLPCKRLSEGYVVAAGAKHA